MGKVNTTDYRDGGLEVFKRLEISVNDGSLTVEAFQHELRAWQAAQYEAVTKEQIDLSTSRQATAQLRELAKIQQEVLANDQKLIESHARVSAIYGNANVVTPQFDALANHTSRQV